MRAIVIFVVAAGALIAGWLLLRPAATPAALTPEYNVVLISIDTLRADHLGCYGHPRVKTPNIDRLATEGARFTQAITAAPLTLPAHTTMLTSLYPYAHTVRVNGDQVPDGVVTLTEILKQAGYRTAAEVGAFVLNRSFGLSQGFDSYGDLESGERGPAKMRLERNAQEVTDAALKQLDGFAGSRFFLFVHYYDPHARYTPPEPYRSQYENPYEGEIAYTDAQVGRILDKLDQMGAAGKTIVILTADHGEGLGEHGEATHGVFLFDTTMHVPLLMRAPGAIPPGGKHDALVRHVDLAPTVLDLLGAPALAAAQGASLRPLLTGGADGAARTAYGESMQALSGFGYAPLRMLRSAQLKYIHAPKLRLYDLQRDPREQTNLADQRLRETADLRDELRLRMAEAQAITTQRSAASDAVTKGLEGLGYVQSRSGAAKLTGRTELELFELPGLDPHEYTQDIAVIQLSLELTTRDDFAQAEQLLTEFLAVPRNPVSTAWAGRTLGRLLSRRGAHAEAAKHYRAAVTAAPDDMEALTDLASNQMELGRPEEALALFERALQLPLVSSRTHLNYAIALARVGRSADAEKQLTTALSINPDDVDTRLALANGMRSGGRPTEALEQVELALKSAPDLWSALLLRGELLAQLGRGAEALEVFTGLAARYPRLTQARVRFAETASAMGRHADAEAALRSAMESGLRNGPIWHTLAGVLVLSGRVPEAIEALRSGLQVEPDHAGLNNDLAWVLSTSPDETRRNGAEALSLAEKAVALTARRNPNMLSTLAAALAENGRFDEALAALDEALTLAAAARADALIDRYEKRRALLQQQQPIRDER